MGWSQINSPHSDMFTLWWSYVSYALGHDPLARTLWKHMLKATGSFTDKNYFKYLIVPLFNIKIS